MSAVADAIEAALISHDPAGHNLEPANVVDVLNELAVSAKLIARSITPCAAGTRDANGGHVESLTEAVMGITGGLVQIAEAIHALASAIQSHGDAT